MSVLPRSGQRASRTAVRAAVRTAAAALASALLLTGCSDSEDADPEASAPGPDAPVATGTTTPAPEDDARAPGRGGPLGEDLVSVPRPERTRVAEGTRDYFAGVTTALSSPERAENPRTPEGKGTKDAKGASGDAGVTEVTGVAGAALDELRNTVAEYADNGWKVKGRAKVLDEQVVRRVGDSALVVRACVDNSAVRVVDTKGRPVPNSSPARSRTLNVLTLVRRGEVWTVTEQRPARNPNC